MHIALVTGREPLDAEFLEDVLRLAGHEVARVESAREDARRLGWLEAPRTSDSLAIVVSRFPRIVAPLGERKDLRILVEPSTPQQVLAAVTPDAPRLPSSIFAPDFDWSTLDTRLEQHGLAGLRADAQLGSIASLAARSVNAPIAFVALVDSKRQRFVGEHGLPPDLRAAGGTPREWSFCQHVVTSEAPLAVEDATLVPTLADSPLVRFGVVRAYAGVPVRAGGTVVGTVCALSTERRAFTVNELASLELAAQAAEARLASLRAPARVTLPPSDLVSAPSPESSLVPAAANDSAENLVGATIEGKYLVTSELGEGGMSRVYLAREKRLGRLVAIKVLEASVADEVLMREARQLVAIRHPCIMQLYDWGRLPDGRSFLVLEHVRGESLRDRIHALKRARTWLPRDRFFRILRNLAGALETLHGAGLVHGDVKPGNVLMDDALDRVVLIDFGLAMNASETPGARMAGGTVGYSAPEQLNAAKLTEALPTLDVYALSALAYTLLTFVSPFSRLAPELRLAAQIERAFTPPSRIRPDLGVTVDAVFERALSPDPRQRYGTVTAFVDALDVALPGRAPSRTLSAGSMLAVVSGDDPASEPRSRGGAVTRVRRAVVEEMGEAAEAALVASLPRADRAALHDAFRLPKDLIPTRAYSAYLRAYANGDLRRIFAITERVSREVVPELLAGFPIERAPHTVLRAAEALFHRFHAWGTLRFARESADRLRIELTMPRELAPEQCQALMGAAVGTLHWVRRDVRIHEVVCVASGAEACVIDVDWSGS